MKRQQKGGAKNKKSFYKQQFQQSKRSDEIKQGITGFMITCDPNKEQRCVKEIFNVLNDWVEKLYPDLDIAAIIAAKPKPVKPDGEVKEEQEKQVKQSVGIDQQIQEEIAGLKRNRIFFVFETATQGVVFIKLLDELRPYIDVNKLGVAIVKHVAETKESQSRFACRFIPIDILCKAKMDDFQAFAKPILAKYFTLAQSDNKPNPDEESKTQPISWAMEFKNKNNNNLKKKEVLDFIFKSVDGTQNPVDLKNSDLSVVIEVYRDLLMIGVVPGYKDKKKYNLQQLIKEDAGDDDNSDEEDPGNRRPVIKLKDLILGKRNQPDDQNQQPDQIKIDSPIDDEEDESEDEKPHESSSSSEDEEIRLI